MDSGSTYKRCAWTGADGRRLRSWLREVATGRPRPGVVPAAAARATAPNAVHSTSQTRLHQPQDEDSLVLADDRIHDQTGSATVGRGPLVATRVVRFRMLLGAFQELLDAGVDLPLSLHRQCAVLLERDLQPARCKAWHLPSGPALLIAGHPSGVIASSSSRDERAFPLCERIRANGRDTPPAVKDRLDRREVELLAGLGDSPLEFGLELLAFRGHEGGQRRAYGRAGAVDLRRRDRHHPSIAQPDPAHR